MPAFFANLLRIFPALPVLDRYVLYKYIYLYVSVLVNDAKAVANGFWVGVEPSFNPFPAVLVIPLKLARNYRHCPLGGPTILQNLPCST